MIKQIKSDISLGGNLLEIIHRKVCHTLYTHKYELRSLKPFYKKGKIINIGSGRDTGKLGKNVVDFDIRRGQDEYTNKLKWESINPDIVGDMHNTEQPDNYYDCVIATHVLEHAKYPELVLKEFFRITKSGGCIALIIPCSSGNPWYHYTKDTTHEVAWTRYDFLSWLLDNKFISPKSVKGLNKDCTGTVVQYSKMKKWLNMWSVDCVIRKN